MPNFFQGLKSHYRKLPALQAARLPLAALEGIDDKSAATLERIGISRVVDLAASPVFNGARAIGDAARDTGSMLNRLGTVPSSMVDGDIEQLAPAIAVEQSIRSLQGVGENEARALHSATGADTISKLAEWPPFLAARHVVEAAGRAPASSRNLPLKLRLRLTAVGSDAPLKLLALECIALLNRPSETQTDHFSSIRYTLGSLASDHVGYLSFDLRPLHNILQTVQVAAVAAIYLEVVGAREVVIDLSGYLFDGHPTERVVPLSVPLEVTEAIGTARGLPAIQNADFDDWRLSPYSFTMAALPSIGEGACETLLPSSLPTRTVGYLELVREAGVETPIGKDGGGYKLAHLAHYETVWQPLGHALGEVLYSLTLAPGEAARMAVLDWGRDETTVRRESTTTDEYIAHGMRRDRLVDEVMDAAITEYQHGESFQGGTAGVGGYGGQGSGSMWGVTGSHAVGYASASSGGRRDVAAQNTQRLADAVSQASHAVRALRSTVVLQATQAEKATAQTRYVRNYNHSHALTVLYYQIVRHYLLTTRVSRWRAVLLLRRQRPAFALPVTATPPEAEPAWRRAARRYSAVLRDSLLDKSLSPILDALDEYELRDAEELRFLDSAQLVGVLVELSTGDDNADHDRVRLSLIPARGTPVTWELASLETSRTTTTPHLAGWSIDTYEGNSTTAFFLKPEVGIVGDDGRPGVMLSLAPAQIVGAIVSFNAEEGGQSWTLQRIRITGTFQLEDRTRRIVLVDGPATPWKPTNDSDLVFDIVPPARQPLLDRLAEREAGLERLRRHLYERGMRYSAAVWMAADPNEVIAELQTIPWASEAAGSTLADFVEPMPLGVIGEYVAYPLGAWQATEESGTEVAKRLASLPTRGAFAEAQLSHCNASEVIDDNRFWDWQISPIPDADQAPEIEPVSMTSRARELALAPTVPAATIGIEQPEAAPEPSSIAAILDFVTRSEIFRDMSKADQLAAILQELTKAAASVEQERMKSLVQLDKNQTDLERENMRADREDSPEAPGSTPPPTAGPAPTAGPPPVDAAQPATPSQTRSTPREVNADLQTIDREEPDPQTRQARRSRVLDRLAPARPVRRHMRFEFFDRWGRPTRGVFAIEVTDDDRGGASAGADTSDASGNHVRVEVPETLRSATIRIRVQEVTILGTGDLDGLAGLFGGGSTVLTGTTSAAMTVEGETRLAVLDPADARSYDFYVTFAAESRSFTVTTESEARAQLEAAVGLRLVLSASAVGHVSVGGSVQTTIQYVFLTGGLDIVQGRRGSSASSG